MTDNSYEISTGAHFFYKKANEPACICFELELTENIVQEALQEATKLTLVRFPCFATRLEATVANDRYFLRSNAKPFVVYEQAVFLPVKDTRANDYMITICFSGAKLYFSFFHGLTDAVGACIFIKALIHTYLCKSTGKKFECPNVMDVYDTPDPSEYCDPYEFLSELPRFHPFRFDEPFSFPENQIDETHIKLYSIRIPSDILLGLSSRYEGSVSGTLSLILCRAIDAVCPNLNKPIAISNPVNLRRMLCCESTLRNCNQSMKYVYSDKIKKYSFDQQLSMFKGMLYIQTMKEHQLPRYAMVRDDLKKANQTRTIEEKKEFYSQNSGLASVPIVSYMGNFEAGECTNAIKSISSYLKVSGRAGMLLLVLCYNNEFIIQMTSNLKNDDYYFSFLEQLKTLKIPFALSDPIELQP